MATNQVLTRFGPIINWQTASIAFDEGRRSIAKQGAIRICNNTYLSRMSNGDYVMQFHGSLIITYKADGSIILSSHGQRTATTRHRLSQFSPFRIVVHDGRWYVERIDSVDCLFFDGMHFTVAEYGMFLRYKLVNPR